MIVESKPVTIIDLSLTCSCKHTVVEETRLNGVKTMMETKIDLYREQSPIYVDWSAEIVNVNAIGRAVFSRDVSYS